MELNVLLRFLHVVSVVVWIGGMFFAYLCLRPALAVLEPPARLALLAGALQRFFRWVWLAMGLIVLTGTHGLVRAGADAPLAWHLMGVTGAVMAGVFVSIQARPYPAFRRHLADGRMADAAAAHDRVRRLVGLNLALGMVTLALALLGPLLGR